MTGLYNRGAGGRQDLGGRRFYRYNIGGADAQPHRPARSPSPAWLIRSTRTRDERVYSIAVQADGKILAGGDFNTIGGQIAQPLRSFNNDTAALQNLAVTQTTITWTRGGSSPATRARYL